MRTDTLLLALDLAGTLAFALNGALTVVRTARPDIVGVVTCIWRHRFGHGPGSTKRVRSSGFLLALWARGPQALIRLLSALR
ncbi:MAG TPA: hypothetical protein VN748_20170 [Pseudonocardiaceae bacterium]|jgi:hypothetical protein|nr:hypothetical protein [Pseudonocardiaceae bacterium]